MKISQWEHFKSNLKWTTSLLIIISVWMFLNLEDNEKLYALAPLFLIAVGAVGNYFSWKKKYK